MDEMDEAQERAQVNPFQGVLRCSVCGATEPLGDPRQREKAGWPVCDCSGLTMLWVVGREERVG